MSGPVTRRATGDGRFVVLVVALALLLGACAPRYGFVPFSLTCPNPSGTAAFDARYPPTGTP